MTKKRILLVEDDEMASELICDFLQNRGFSIQPVFTATDAISHLRIAEYDLLLLDINLPDYDGYEVLKSLRGYTNIPVVVTSAFGDTESKLQAFNNGADDYMTKPLDLEELEARIRLRLKHARALSPSTREEKEGRGGAFRVQKNDIHFHREPLGLTAIEYDVLSSLLKRANEAVTREELMALNSSHSSVRSLDNHIKNIRKKLGEHGSNPRYLRTVYGVGYLLKL